MKNTKTTIDTTATTTIDTANMKIDDKKALLARLEHEVEIDEYFTEKVKSLIKSAENELHYYTEETHVVGTEDKQATNSNGEPLFIVPGQWKKLTQADIDALDNKTEIEGAIKPYYKDITEVVTVPYDELGDYSRTNYDAISKLIKALKELI